MNKLIILILLLNSYTVFSQQVPKAPIGNQAEKKLRKFSAPEQKIIPKGMEATVIVGDVDGDLGPTTRNYIKNAKEMSSKLKALGVKVNEFYTPNTDWESIRTSMSKSTITIYSGHGVGSKLEPDYIQTSVGGFALKNKFVSNLDISETIPMKNKAIVLFVGACFSAGNMSYDMGKIDAREAKKRIAMYSEPFLSNDFEGYFATWSHHSAMAIISELFAGNSFANAYDSVETSNVTKTNHPTVSGKSLFMHEGKRGGKIFDFAFAGNPDSTLAKIATGQVDENATSKKQSISPEEQKRLNQDLHYQISKKDIQKIESALKKGADPDSKQGSWPAIHLAVHYKSLGALKLLIDSKADVNATLESNGFKWTAYSLAESVNFTEGKELLKASGARLHRSISKNPPPIPNSQ